MDEVEIMAAISHPHIVMLLGACIEGPSWVMITEFCGKGDLDGILHKGGPLSLSKKTKFALDICAGMAWLTGDHVRPSTPFFIFFYFHF